MRLIVRFYLIWIFLCNVFFVKAQRIDVFSYPDSLFNSGNFKLAAVEYERIYFISDDIDTKNDALLKKSFCYKQDNQYEVAAKTLKRIDFNNINDSTYYKSCYEYALNTFLNEDYKETILQLNEMHTKQIDTFNNNNLLVLRILTLNELRKWDEANTSLINYIKTNNIKVDSFAFKKLSKKPGLKNEKLAKNISYFFPGSGQIYSGHWGRGLSSLILSGAFATYTYVSFINGFYYAGVFSGFSTFRMFWTGGANYAEYLAKQKNKDRITKHNKKIKDLIYKTNTIQ